MSETSSDSIISPLPRLAAQHTDYFPRYSSALPAQRIVTFNDGNAQPALDSHDERSLSVAARSDTVVLSDDPTLGQTVQLGFGEVPAPTVGTACAAVAAASALALVTDVVDAALVRFAGDRYARAKVTRRQRPFLW